MGLKGHDTRDIFPDFRTYVFPPVSPAWFDPKSWGIADLWVAFSGGIEDPRATFITDNVQVGDAAYILDVEPTATTVAVVFSEILLTTVARPVGPVPNPRYKVGHGPHHTIQSLASIVGQRAITYHTIHHGKLWTGAIIPHWNTDETGEVYVISHDTGKALWLDGIFDYPVGFPDDPDRPPELLAIADWEDRFPGVPRPDYPPGLEPAGELRAILIDKYGSLLIAHESKSKVHE